MKKIKIFALGVFAMPFLLACRGSYENSMDEETTESDTEISVEMTTELTTEIPAEMTAEAATDETAEMTTETTTEKTPEVTTETTTDETSEMTTEATIVETPEMTAESTTEMPEEIATEPTQELTTEAFTEPSTEVATEVPAEQTTIPTTVPATTVTEAVRSVNGLEICKTALGYLGLNYVYGGDSLVTGTDCSGFTRLIYAMYGIEGLPRTAAGQAGLGGVVMEPRPGDLCAVAYSSSMYTGHAGIYIGNGMMVSAYPSGDSGSVCVTPVEYGMSFHRLFENSASEADYESLRLWMLKGSRSVMLINAWLEDGVPYLSGQGALWDTYEINISDANKKDGMYLANNGQMVPESFVLELKSLCEKNGFFHTVIVDGSQIKWLEDGTPVRRQDYWDGIITKEQWDSASEYATQAYSKFW